MSDNKIDVTLEMGMRIKQERKRLKLSQAEIGEKLDMTERNYGRIERGKQGTYLRNIKKLAEIFSVDVEYLLCDPNHPYRNDLERELHHKWEHEREHEAVFKREYYLSKVFSLDGIPRILSGTVINNNNPDMVITCYQYPVKDLVEYIVKNGGYTQILDGLRIASEYIDK